MLAEVIRTLFGHNAWAMEKILEAASRLTPEQFVAPGELGLRSVRDTLIHSMNAHRNWVSFCDGTLFTDEAARNPLSEADFPDVAAVRMAWKDIEARTQQFIGGLSDEEAARVYSGKNPDGTEWGISLRKAMLHIIIHSAQHRSEAAATLSSFGHSPGDLDLLFYPEAR